MYRLLLAALLCSMGAATTAALMAIPGAGGQGQAQTATFDTPKRISSEPPPIAPPARLPRHAPTLPRLTFVVTTTRSRTQGLQRTAQTIVRSADRIRLATAGSREEWLFVQNQAYPDRVTGYLVDHAARQIRFHDESPLRERLRIRGWLDVLTIRFDPAVLGTLRETGERRDVAGASVSRFVGPASSNDGIVEVWWSEELLLPISVTMRASGTEITSVVDGLARGGDATLLADPAARFPSYTSLDVGDADDH